MGPGKRGHIVADTLLPTQMFPCLPVRATFVADTKLESGTQKMFLILFRNILCPQQHSFCVSRVCALKKHHSLLHSVYSPKFCINYCCETLLGICRPPKEFYNNSLCKIWGQTVHYGQSENSQWATIRPCHTAAILSWETGKALFYHAKPRPHGFDCEAWRGKTKLFWSPGTIWPPCDKGECIRNNVSSFALCGSARRWK